MGPNIRSNCKHTMENKFEGTDLSSPASNEEIAHEIEEFLSWNRPFLDRITTKKKEQQAVYRQLVKATNKDLLFSYGDTPEARAQELKKVLIIAGIDTDNTSIM